MSSNDTGEFSTQTPLGQADDLIKKLLDDVRGQFKSEPELREFLCRLGLLRGGKRVPSRTKTWRILGGDQPIHARELLAILISMGYVIQVKKPNGEAPPGNG